MRKNKFVKTLKKSLLFLFKAIEEKNCSGEELKSITEAIEILVDLIKNSDFIPCDSCKVYLQNQESIMEPSIKN